DAQLPGRLQVDGVGADATGGDHAQSGQAAENITGPFDGAAGINQASRSLGPAELLLHAQGPIEVKNYLPRLPEPFQMRRALQLRRVIAWDHDADHGCSFLFQLSVMAMVPGFGSHFVLESPPRNQENRIITPVGDIQGESMAKAIVDPGELRRFAQSLK